MPRDKYDFYLETANVSDGSLNELQLLALQRCGVSSSQLNEAWNLFLIDRGFSNGPLNERMYAWLGSRGFSGSLEERLESLYQVTGVDLLLCSLTLYVDEGYVTDGYV